MGKKKVLITGGTSGIGKACAHIFGKHGFIVLITGRNSEKLASTVDELVKSKIEAFVYQADNSSEKDIKVLHEKIQTEHGDIDVLINNAGISMNALFNNLELETFKKVMDINFMGSVIMTKCFLPSIIKTKGSILFNSSIAGWRGLPCRTAYSASKFALHGFFESLRTEVMHLGVHVLLVCPGYTASNIRNVALNAKGEIQQENPMEEKKLMTSEQVAEEMYRGYVKKKRMIVLTTMGKFTKMMNMFFPSWMDKIVYEFISKEKNSPLNR